ncbi:NAD(P)-binding domain-containing protein [Saccharopolyspora gloriosae]|uniref:NAD(P)-binding domain-containing protein n=1 Tax=Saccharopolyspora gloriosae TaxID=455344 RepID=UPI00215DECDA|nr:NAD(P)-binding domain-containing protein [Saccharopolyspora gloriosae]
MIGLRPVGIIGAGPIGSGLTHNLVRNGIGVVLHSRSLQNPARTKASTPTPGLVTVAESIQTVIDTLGTPRVIITAVSDTNTAKVLTELLDVVDEGDIVIDVSNADAVETSLRQLDYAYRGAALLAGGLASGEYGATNGISLTVSGDGAAYEKVRGMLESIAMHIGDQPCVCYLGSGSSSHLVKTIHNGLEYSLMQLFSEIVVVLRELCGMGPRTNSRHAAFLE